MNYETSRTSQTVGADELLFKHYKRLRQERGSFGCWRRRPVELSCPRWIWYSELLLFKKIPKAPLPQMHFVDDLDGRAKKLVLSLLKPNTNFDDVLNTLLHLFGHPGYEKVDRKNIDFPLVEALSLERDIFGDAYSEVMGKNLRSGTGYFPTPQNICNMIVEMTMPDCQLTNTVNDPCVGSGRMLLAASNKSLFLYGNDINMTCVKMTLVNGYLFSPWLAIPPPPEIKHNNNFRIGRNIYAENNFSF